MAVNINQIAQKTRLSAATVSRTINGVPTVHPVLARRVWRAIEELGYYPNTQARALVSGKSRLLGLIVPDLTNPFFTEFIRHFEQIAVNNEYELLLASTAHSPESINKVVRRMLERRVDGVAVIALEPEEPIITPFRDRKIPVAFLTGSIAGEGGIQINYEHGMRLAVQHLVALRHSRIAFVSESPDIPMARAKKCAFDACMKEIELDVHPELHVVADNSMQGGMHAVAQLISFSDRPTALICTSDLIAMGVLCESPMQGLFIPEDLSVIGFDDIPQAEFTNPPLTSIRLSQAELAESAFNALCGKTESATSHRCAVFTELRLRKTTSIASPAGQRIFKSPPKKSPLQPQPHLGNVRRGNSSGPASCT